MATLTDRPFIAEKLTFRSVRPSLGLLCWKTDITKVYQYMFGFSIDTRLQSHCIQKSENKALL